MNIQDTIEDAFIECLEQGARLPSEFSVRLPWEAFISDTKLPMSIRVAGYSIRLRFDIFADLSPLPMVH